MVKVGSDGREWVDFATDHPAIVLHADATSHRGACATHSQTRSAKNSSAGGIVGWGVGRRPIERAQKSINYAAIMPVFRA